MNLASNMLTKNISIADILFTLCVYSSFSTSQLDHLLIYLKNRDEKRMMSRDYMLAVKAHLDEIYEVSAVHRQYQLAIVHGPMNVLGRV